MVRANHLEEGKLYLSLPEVRPELPIPRIEITRWFGSTGGFSSTRQMLWTIRCIGLNDQPLPKEDEVISSKSAEHIASQWQALLGWPVVRLRRVVQSQSIYKLEDDSYAE